MHDMAFYCKAAALHKFDALNHKANELCSSQSRYEVPRMDKCFCNKIVNARLQRQSYVAFLAHFLYTDHQRNRSRILWHAPTITLQSLKSHEFQPKKHVSLQSEWTPPY